MTDETVIRDETEAQRLKVEQDTRQAEARREADAERSMRAAGVTGSGSSLDPSPEAVKTETGKLIHDKQDLERDRVMREQAGAQSNRPTPEDPEPDTAAARLRALEDDWFGPDAVRINGFVERGSGSPYSQLSDADKLHYTALERLVIAEQKFDDAQALASQAEADRAAAEQNLEAAEKAADDARAEAEKQAEARQARLDRQAEAKRAPQPARV